MTHAFTSVVTFLFLISLAQSAKAETFACGAGNVQCLIAAINQANADPRRTTIWLAPGMYLLANTDNDIDGPTALPSIVSPIRIEAYGVTLGRTSGSPAFRFFLVGRAGALRLNGLTVTEGDSGSGSGKSGGALLNRGGNVTVVDSVFEGNTAFFGGAIYNDGGTLTIHDSTITRNTAIGSGAGLINVGGRVIVSRTDFDANHGSGDGSVETEGGEMYIVGSRFLNCGFRKF